MSQRQPSALGAIAVVLVILLLVLIPGQILTRLIMRPFFQGGSESVASQIVGNVSFLLVYLALWVWLRWSSKRPFWSLGFERDGAIRHVLRGALVAALMMAATAGLAVARAAVIGLLNLFLFGVFTGVYSLAQGGLWGRVRVARSLELGNG